MDVRTRVGTGGYWMFFFQAEDGIRDLVRSRGLGDVYKRQGCCRTRHACASTCVDDLCRGSLGQSSVHRFVFSFLSLIHI